MTMMRMIASMRAMTDGDHDTDCRKSMGRRPPDTGYECSGSANENASYPGWDVRAPERAWRNCARRGRNTTPLTRSRMARRPCAIWVRAEDRRSPGAKITQNALTGSTSSASTEKDFQERAPKPLLVVLHTRHRGEDGKAGDISEDSRRLISDERSPRVYAAVLPYREHGR